MHAAFDTLHQEYSRVLADMNVATAQLHPLADVQQWSAQEVIAHLILTYRSTCGMLMDRLEKGRPTQRRSTFAQPFIRFAVLSCGIMPKGFSAPERVRPHLACFPPMSGRELSQRMGEELQLMNELLDKCRLSFPRHRVASHFLLGPLRADQFRRFHVVHGRHHLGQLARIRRQIITDETATH